jgi:hypothetical protein
MLRKQGDRYFRVAFGHAHQLDTQLIEERNICHKKAPAGSRCPRMT